MKLDEFKIKWEAKLAAGYDARNLYEDALSVIREYESENAAYRARLATAENRERAKNG